MTRAVLVLAALMFAGQASAQDADTGLPDLVAIYKHWPTHSVTLYGSKELLDQFMPAYIELVRKSRPTAFTNRYYDRMTRIGLVMFHDISAFKQVLIDVRKANPSLKLYEVTLEKDTNKVVEARLRDE